jgi:hypothetical protein
VTGTQRSSRSPVYVGRRSDAGGFEFAGFIRDVRVHSQALTAAEIAADMTRRATETPAPERVPGETQDEFRRHPYGRDHPAYAPCAVFSDHEDQHIPIVAAAVGLLAAVAGVGFWPNGGWLLWLVASIGAGLLLPTSTLPSINLWLVPLTSLAGGAAVVASVRRRPR